MCHCLFPTATDYLDTVVALLSSFCSPCQAFSYSVGFPAYFLLLHQQIWRAGKGPPRLGLRWIWAVFFRGALLQQFFFFKLSSKDEIKKNNPLEVFFTLHTWNLNKKRNWALENVPATKSCWHWQNAADQWCFVATRGALTEAVSPWSAARDSRSLRSSGGKAKGPGGIPSGQWQQTKRKLSAMCIFYSQKLSKH